MKKKSLLIAALAVLGAGMGFAQGNGFEAPDAGKKSLFSAGLGCFLRNDFESGFDFESKQFDVKNTTRLSCFGGGGFIFLDAAYAELNLAISSGKSKLKSNIEEGPKNTLIEQNGSLTYFNIGLLGKYPIAVGEKLKVFPLIGIEYDICFSAKDEEGDEAKNIKRDDNVAKEFSALWFKLGGGMDFAVTEKFYLRFEALYGLRPANKFENNTKDTFCKVFKALGIDIDAKTLLGKSFTAKLAAGYTF